jgi:hypothetical protein
MSEPVPTTTEGEDLALYDRCAAEGRAAYEAGLSALACCYPHGGYACPPLFLMRYEGCQWLRAKSEPPILGKPNDLCASAYVCGHRFPAH